jgi:hypothetical protein
MDCKPRFLLEFALSALTVLLGALVVVRAFI